MGLSVKGVQNYASYFDGWLTTGLYSVDCDEKKKVLQNMFEQSLVAMIYGSAGTGKSTLINHISNLFKDESKLYLANTNPAVDNMRRRVRNMDDAYGLSPFTSRETRIFAVCGITLMPNSKTQAVQLQRPK
jgi:energy-coupling factor transporter ATP-binding protein EcfA2